MATVIAFPWKDHYAIFQKDALMVAPTCKISQVVGADYKREFVLRLTLLKRIQGTDGVLGRRHVKFDVLNTYLEIRMTGDGLQGGIVSAMTCGKTVDVFERILRSDNQINHIEAGFLCKETDNGLVTFM